MAMIIPGVQMPHCTAPARAKAACTSASAPGCGGALGPAGEGGDHAVQRPTERDQAAQDRFAVQQHRARTAAALAAAGLGGGVAEFVPEDVQERRPWRGPPPRSPGRSSGACSSPGPLRRLVRSDAGPRTRSTSTVHRSRCCTTCNVVA